MLRKSFVVIAILMLGVTAAAAQSCQDTITARQDLMKKSGAMAKAGASMVKGETPFDLDKTKEIFATFANDAKQMPTLFPDCSKEGDHTTAAATIWEKSDDFKAAIAKFATDIKAGQDNTKDLDTFKASFGTIGKDCGGCHQTFRVRPS
jgi:cytochrome c556